MTARSLGITIAVVLVGLLLGLGIYAYNNLVVTGPTSGNTPFPGFQSTSTPAALTSFTVEKPDLVAMGTGLVRVEIWAVPTGTGITEANYQLLGRAALHSETGGVQTWTMPIPAQPLLATEIFAKAFDKKGALVGRLSLPYIGASSLYDALWGAATPPTGGGPASTTASFVMKVGDKATFGGLTLKFLSVVSDSRCPQDAVCVWAGEVQAQVQLTAAGQTKTVILHSNAAATAFAGYEIAIADVAPARTSTAPAQGSYRITFSVDKT